MAAKNKLEVTLALIDQATAPLQAFSKRIEKLQEPIRRISNKLAIFGQAAGFGKLRGAAGGVATAFGDVADKAGALATKVVASVALVGGALFSLVKMTADAGDRFDELSVKAGVSASYFQKVAYAASFSSVNQEDLANSMAKMNSNIVAAISGNKEMVLWFKRAGLSVADLKKMKPEDVFNRIMEAVNKLPKDSAKAGALLRGILGKSGAALLPMAEGFKELTDEAERLGLVLSDETVKAGADFNDTFDKMMKVMKGIGMMIGGILMPYFKEAISAITEWSLSNRELIKTKVSEWVASIKENWPEIKQGALDAWAAIKQVVSVIQGAVELVGGFGNALRILAVVMAGPLLIALGQLAIAIGEFGLVLLTTPVGWFLLAIAAIAGAVYLIYRNWDTITGWFAALWDSVKAVFSAAWEGIKLLFSWSPLVLIMNNWEPIKDYFSGLWDWISNLFSENIAKLTGWLKNLNPLNAVSGAWDFGAQMLGGGSPALGAAAGAAPAAAASVAGGTSNTNNAAVQVDFKNVPRGTEITPASNNSAPLDLSMGYAGVTY